MTVIMPGSYDPVTTGHLEMIKRVAAEADGVYAVVFNNPNKTYTFSVEDRVSMLMLATDGLDNVLVSYSSGLVIDYMRDHGIDKIVKGYRNDADLEWEREQAEYNRSMGGYETQLIKCDDEYRHISSTLVRERLKTGESIDGIVPLAVAEYIKNINRKDDIK